MVVFLINTTKYVHKSKQYDEKQMKESLEGTYAKYRQHILTYKIALYLYF